VYIISEDHVTEIDQRYVVLELDTVVDPETKCSKTYYGVVQTLPLGEMPSSHMAAESHKQLMEAYKRQDWQFCASAAKGLKGRWNGEMDSFYDHLLSRLDKFLVLNESSLK